MRKSFLYLYLMMLVETRRKLPDKLQNVRIPNFDPLQKKYGDTSNFNRML